MIEKKEIDSYSTHIYMEFDEAEWGGWRLAISSRQRSGNGPKNYIPQKAILEDL